MNETNLDQERIWERGWEGHELAQLQRMARLPLSEKLDWLEQAHDLVLNIQRSQVQVRLPAEAVPSDDCSHAVGGDAALAKSRDHFHSRLHGDSP